MEMESYNKSDHKSGAIHQPFFSVVITTYNRANILNRALDSLIGQTEHDWEAIVVDDESTDNTYLKLLPYLWSNPQIRYLRKVHSGEPLSKNAGINTSFGKFITFLDSDDEYSPIHLQTRKAILAKDPAIRFLHGGVMIIGNQYVPDRFDYKKRIHLNECVIGGTFFIERDLLFQLSGFRKIMLGTDADLYDRVVEAGIQVNKTKIPTYIYHHENEDSITNMLLRDNAEAQEIFSDINSK